MSGSSRKSSHRSGHKSSHGSKSSSGSRRQSLEFTVYSNPASLIHRNEVLNPYLICSLTAQGVSNLPAVDQMSAVALLMDISGEVVLKENSIQNHNVSPQEVFPSATQGGGSSSSGSSDTRYFYFYFDAMTVDPDPGDYYFEISLYDWSSGVDVIKTASTTSSSFSVV